MIDLRFPWEVEQYRSVYAGSNQPPYYPLPFVETLATYKEQFDHLTDGAALYLGLLGSPKTQRTLKAIFSRLASSDGGVILFHCSAGKDRTGLISMLLLNLVGVSDEVIIEDYALSEKYLALAMPTAYSKPETMEGTLIGLKETYGGAEGYLKSAGLSDATLAALKEKLIE